MHTVTAHSRLDATPTLPRLARAFLRGARKAIALAGAPYMNTGLPPA